MIRLVFSDLRDHVTTWVGAFVVALGCGYIGGWAASLMTTAGLYTGEMNKSLQNAGSMMLVFSLIAAVAVLISTANLTVASQRRSYALWQLVNVRPWLVSVVVLVQLAVVASTGAVCGTLLAAATLKPLFPLVFSARQAYAQVIPQVGVSSMPLVWLVVVGVFLCGGLKGARNAGMTPPLTALREPEPKRMKMTWLRALFFMGLVALTYATYYYAMVNAAPETAITWSVFVPVLVVAALVPLAPLIFSTLLTLWTALVPQRWNAWFLARHSARYGLSTSTSVETPIMVGFGLVAGLFSVMNILADYARSQGVTDTSGYFPDSTLTLLMLGGPVLLCAIGASVSVMMSSRSRTQDIALLDAIGARPATQIMAAGCEALIHTITATLVGMFGTVVSSAIVAHALGLPLFGGVSFAAGFIVSIVGLVLVLVATLVPTFSALNRETAALLAKRE